VAKRWIVVGGGVAGSVVAARLATAGAAVTVLELGVDGSTPDDLHEAASLPGRTIESLLVRRVDNGPLVTYTSGSGIGGGSSINPGWAARTGPFHHSHQLPLEGDGLQRRVLRGGSRVSVSDVYCDQVPSGVSLHIRTGSAVERVMFDNGLACGVELGDGEMIEGDFVVLCAGALMSPALLLKSGIDGDGVGRGLQDHPSVVLKYRNGDQRPHGWIQMYRTGQIQVVETVIGDELWVVPALMRPQSSGAVTLDSESSVEIQFSLCQFERERAEITNAVKEVHAAQSHLEPIDAPRPGEETEWLMQQIASTTPVYSHASGGCAMGSVTDRCGRMLNVDNLFVVDASVFPAIPSVNPMVPTVQLAETVTGRWMAEGLVSN